MSYIENKKLEHKNEMEELFKNSKVLTTEEIQTLFRLEQPMPLSAPLVIRKTPHPLAPKIIEDYYFPPTLLRQLLSNFWDKLPLMLVGEKGTGKTTLIEQIHARLGMPLISINGGPDVDEDMLFGRPSLKDGNVVDLDGQLSYGFRHGIPVCINELSLIPDGVQSALNAVLEKGDRIVLNHRGLDPTMSPEMLASDCGNVIVRHPSFRIYSTDNTGGKLSFDGRYSSAGIINSASRSRWLTLNVGFTPAATERAILESTVNNHWVNLANDSEAIKPLLAGVRSNLPHIQEFCDYVRKGFSEGKVSDNVSLREMQNWVIRYLSLQDLDLSFKETVLNGAQEEDLVFMYDAFEHTFNRQVIMETAA